jgi:DNA-binding NarL/FixJ family response regulator
MRAVDAQPPRAVEDAGTRANPHLTTELTPRQQEVVRLIARGYTNAQIAELLVVTRGTAANHVAAILARLDLTNRTQVATWAIAAGLLSEERPDTARDGHRS